MSGSLEETTAAYAVLISSFAKSNPSHRALQNFVNGWKYNPTAVGATKITLVQLEPGGHGGKPTINFRAINGADALAEYIREPIDESAGLSCCRLFIVENICPKSVCVLGGHLNIGTQFFADHIRTPYWASNGDASRLTRPLTSTRSRYEHLQLRFFELRTIESTSTRKNPLFKQNEIDLGPPAYSSSEPRRPSSSCAPALSINRGFGLLTSRPRKNEQLQQVLNVRQTATVWFRRGNEPNQGWTGVLLVDPAVQTKSPHYRIMPSDHLLGLGPGLPVEPTLGASSLQEIVHCLSISYKDSEMIAATLANPFLILADLYRLVASRWLVLQKYIKRELSTIEKLLEGEHPSFQQLEDYLKDLYMYRHTCLTFGKRVELVRVQCSKQGQMSWPREQVANFAPAFANELEADFLDIQMKLQESRDRTDKLINLLTALVAIGESKQSLQESHGVTRLTLLATVFLPFSTVAAILGMSGDYGPGSDKFWMFWIVALPLTACLVGIFLFFDQIYQLIAGRLRGVFHHVHVKSVD